MRRNSRSGNEESQALVLEKRGWGKSREKGHVGKG